MARLRNCGELFIQLSKVSELRIYINGELKEISQNLTLAELIVELDLPATRVAIELNRTVVRRANWETTMFSEDDRLEIVHFVGGGIF